jgi:hypothetical protein
MTDRIRRFWETVGLTVDYSERWHCYYVYSPEGQELSSLGTFTDLNSLFKWAVPKLNEKGWGVNLMQAMGNKYWKCVLWEWGNPFTSPLDNIRQDGETPAAALFEALCLALEVEG